MNTANPAHLPLFLPPAVRVVLQFTPLLFWKVLSGSLLLVLLSTFTAAAATQPSIQGIRTISSAGVTRVVISLSGPIAYEVIAEPAVSSSASPSRIHLRFAPANLAAGVRTSAKVDDGVLKEIRTGLIADSIVRVSLEVEPLSSYRAMALRSPDQIVIQLRKQRDETRIATRSSARPLALVSSSREPVRTSVDRQPASALAAPLPDVVRPKPEPISPPRLTPNEEKPALPAKEPSPLPQLETRSFPTAKESATEPKQREPRSDSISTTASLRSHEQKSLSVPPPPPIERQAALIPPRPALVPPTPEVEEQPSDPVAPLGEHYRIMLDPGHGGSDPGAQSPEGLQEKSVVLAVSKRLAHKLRTRLKVEVLLTRTTDIFIPLPERTAQANTAKADLFVSIHANASPNAETHGIETYYLNNTNDRATIRLAKLENGIRAKQQLPQRGTELAFILSDLIQTGKEEESIALAQALQSALVTQVRHTVPSANDLGVKKGPFYVLVGAHMPCVLVELAFLTHAEEGQRLGTAAYQEVLAEGLFHGIADFIRTGLSAKNL